MKISINKIKFDPVRIAAGSALCAAFAFSAHAGDVTYERIVSLGPSMTEELYLLGKGDAIVGNTTYCVNPPPARLKDKVGNITDIDIEKIISLKPDLVLATPLVNPKMVRKLGDLGIKVEVLDVPKDFESLCIQFMELGKSVGKEKEAQEIIISARAKAEAIKKRSSLFSRPKVFIQIGTNPVFTANKDYFINDFVDLAGGDNIAADARAGAYSREEVLKRDPDVIIIADMGIASGEEKKAWEKFRTMSAVKDDRIYIIDARKVCSPTPVTFVKTLREIALLLHPEMEKRTR